AVLLSNMKKDTCYEIRRAARDGFVYDFWTTKDASGLNEFCDYYDDFAVRKNQRQLHRGWFFLLAASGSLNLSRVADAAGPTLTWHCYHRADHRATLLYSASVVADDATSAWRNKVGRAN